MTDPGRLVVRALCNTPQLDPAAFARAKADAVRCVTSALRGGSFVQGMRGVVEGGRWRAFTNGDVLTVFIDVTGLAERSDPPIAVLGLYYLDGDKFAANPYYGLFGGVITQSGTSYSAKRLKNPSGSDYTYLSYALSGFTGDSGAVEPTMLMPTDTSEWSAAPLLRRWLRGVDLDGKQRSLVVPVTQHPAKRYTYARRQPDDTPFPASLPSDAVYTVGVERVVKRQGGAAVSSRTSVVAYVVGGGTATKVTSTDVFASDSKGLIPYTEASREALATGHVWPGSFFMAGRYTSNWLVLLYAAGDVETGYFRMQGKDETTYGTTRLWQPFHCPAWGAHTADTTNLATFTLVKHTYTSNLRIVQCGDVPASYVTVTEAAAGIVGSAMAEAAPASAPIEGGTVTHTIYDIQLSVPLDDEHRDAIAADVATIVKQYMKEMDSVRASGSVSLPHGYSTAKVNMNVLCWSCMGDPNSPLADIFALPVFGPFVAPSLGLSSPFNFSVPQANWATLAYNVMAPDVAYYQPSDLAQPWAGKQVPMEWPANATRFLLSSRFTGIGFGALALAPGVANTFVYSALQTQYPAAVNVYEPRSAVEYWAVADRPAPSFPYPLQYGADGMIGGTGFTRYLIPKSTFQVSQPDLANDLHNRFLPAHAACWFPWEKSPRSAVVMAGDVFSYYPSANGGAPATPVPAVVQVTAQEVVFSAEVSVRATMPINVSVNTALSIPTDFRSGEVMPFAVPIVDECTIPARYEDN